jgi:hypothetical protein
MTYIIHNVVLIMGNRIRFGRSDKMHHVNQNLIKIMSKHTDESCF